MSKVKVALIQMAMSDDTDANLAKAMKFVREAGVQGAKIVCLPELFRTPYFPREEKKDFSQFSESIPGQTTEKLAELARELNIVLIAGSIFEKHGDRFYNTAVVIDQEGKPLGTYRKNHIPHDPHFYEQDYFSPGTGSYKIFPTIYGTIGVLICFDQWYPEAARCLALKGADIIFYPTAIGTASDLAADEGDWKDSWVTVQRGHAISNCVYVAAVNRVGKEKELNFWGHSFIANPFGTVVTSAENTEQIVIAECDLGSGKTINENWGFFRNRRPETYEDLCRSRKS